MYDLKQIGVMATWTKGSSALHPIQNLDSQQIHGEGGASQGFIFGRILFGIPINGVDITPMEIY